MAFGILMAGIILGFFWRELFHEPQVSAKIITIHSRNLEYQVETRARTMGELLEETLTDVDLTQTNADTDSRGGELYAGMMVEIRKPLTVDIVDGGNEPITVTTTAESVDDLLREQHIGLAATDRVTASPSPRPSHQGRGIEKEFLPLDGGGWVGVNTFLAGGMTVRIDRIVDLEVTEQSPIPYAVNIEHDPSSFYGREEILKAGQEGRKDQFFLITYKNGVEIKRRLLSEKVLELARAEQRRFGTRIEIEQTEEGRASWYAYQNCLCAAHPSYEKGRFVRVTAVNSGQSNIVRINDRGPDQGMHPDRVIDLDAVAYKTLAPLGSGTIAVRVELLR